MGKVVNMIFVEGKSYAVAMVLFVSSYGLPTVSILLSISLATMGNGNCDWAFRSWNIYRNPQWKT